MKQQHRKEQKMESLDPIYNMVRLIRIKIRVNELWNKQDDWNVKGKWSSRAYFLQDLKRYVPNDISIYMTQCGGTFAKVKR